MMVKTARQIIYSAILKHSAEVGFDILNPPSLDLGDYSVNVAFKLAKTNGQKVNEVAEDVKNRLESDKGIQDICREIRVVNGFINFYLKDAHLLNELGNIIKEGNDYGSSGLGGDKKIDLEFVSANPTGPMTVHNVRAGSFGDCLGNIFKKVGFDVTKEYYINDIGVQVNKLGESVARRLLVNFALEPKEGLYKGDYIKEIASQNDLKELVKTRLGEDIFNRKPLFHSQEEFDGICRACSEYAKEYLIKSAQASMANVGINFDVWFRESQLHEKGLVINVLSGLEASGLVYEKEGAKWFKVSNYFSDQQDAVVVKSDGQTSYLMNDIAYTKNKIEEREFDKAINIWGTDHHGDVPRLLAGAKALGYEDDKLEILLHQLVLVKEKDEYQRMSKREGKFILLDDFLPKVGRDALRFFFLAKDLNTHMEFDVDLARDQSSKNPVFYIQYAFARLNSLFEKIGVSPDAGDYEIGQSYDEAEMNLIRKMAKLPELLEDISRSYKVHHLAEYSLDLANSFHGFYETHRIIENDKVNRSRVALIGGLRIIMNICFSLMGITAPKKM